MKLTKRWVFGEPDPEVVLSLANALSLSEPLARILASRGYATPEEALAFLDADLELLENPWLMADMEKAVERLRIARYRNEKVFVAGDRDVDGVTSTTLLVKLLELLKIASGWKVPEPVDGYGLSANAVRAASAAGASLVLAVDCGIRDFAGVDLARELGLDVVILDHHEPADSLPSAYAVVDPKRSDCAYPFKELCACAVAFKFAQAVLMAEDEDFYQKTIVVFDTETTGMAPRRGDQIIEIAALKSRHGVELDRFQSFLKPSVPVSEAITAVHGISEAMLVDAPEASDVIGRFLAFVGDATLAAHKASFDVGFLKEAAKNLLGVEVHNKVIDTLEIARAELPGVECRLGALSTRFGIKHDEKHRAMSDVDAAYGVLKRLFAIRNTGMQWFLKENMDLVGLATMADVVPLKRENRVLVKRGLETLAKTERPGTVALREVFLRGNTLTAKDIAWSLAPGINAAGRLGKAHLAVELLMAPDLETARRLASEIAGLNDLRKERVKVNVEVVNRIVERSFDPERDAAVVVTAAGIEHGVTGIVANRLMYDLGRPVVILIEDEGDLWKGTSRSIPGFDITLAFKQIADLIDHYGGHSGAAGLAVRRDLVPTFRARLNEYVRGMIPMADLQPVLRIDAELRPQDVGEKLIKDLARLEPTGHGNEHPVFSVRDMEAVDVRRMGDSGQHLKLQLRRDGATIECVAWNAPSPDPAIGAQVDAAFTLEKNEWAGRTRVQCVLVDWRVKD